MAKLEAFRHYKCKTMNGVYIRKGSDDMKNCSGQIWKQHPVKVVFVTSDNIRTSGAFLSMVKLISILREEKQIDPYVILPWHGTGEELLTEKQIPFVCIQSYPWVIDVERPLKERIKIPVKKAINAAAVIKIQKVLKKLKPDVMHINTTWSYVGAEAARREGIPYIWHLREFLEEDQLVSLWNQKKGYSLINGAEHIVLISRALEQKYIGILDQEKVSVIYNGIDTERFYDGNKEILKNNNYNFICVGGLYPGKDQRLLIEACSLFEERGYKNYVLNIVGSGPEENTLKKLVQEKGMENRVFFRGFCKTPEIYYKEADIAFMVSRSEAFGRVTIEAMLGGCLVIGSDSGATTELIGDNDYGYLYSAGDSHSLAEAIRYAVENKELSILKMKAGRERAVNAFTAELNAHAINSLYQEYL